MYITRRNFLMHTGVGIGAGLAWPMTPEFDS